MPYFITGTIGAVFREFNGEAVVGRTVLSGDKSLHDQPGTER
jgi:hypothetical protein